MAPSDKSPKATEVTPPRATAPATDSPDFGDRIGRLESRVIAVETENAELKRALAEQGAELKEVRGDSKLFGDEVENLDDCQDKLGAAMASIATGSTVVVPPKKDDKGEIPEGFFRNGRGLLVENKFKGEKKYELSETAFIGGKLMHAGDRITVIDEQPGSTWKPLVAQMVHEELVATPAPSQLRAADREV